MFGFEFFCCEFTQKKTRKRKNCHMIIHFAFLMERTIIVFASEQLEENVMSTFL